MWAFYIPQACLFLSFADNCTPVETGKKKPVIINKNTCSCSWAIHNCFNDCCLFRGRSRKGSSYFIRSPLLCCPICISRWFFVKCCHHLCSVIAFSHGILEPLPWFVLLFFSLRAWTLARASYLTCFVLFFRLISLTVRPVCFRCFAIDRRFPCLLYFTLSITFWTRLFKTPISTNPRLNMLICN